MTSESSPQRERRSVRIGKYEVVAHIATGGMGAVYRARDTELGREVALKILPPELAANPAMLERFRREARHAARLRHENIVTLYEFGEAHGTHFLALEYIDGTDLQNYITEKGKLEPGEAFALFAQAARALDHAHQQGIVHRDIKPSNFLLTQKDGQLLVKMTDLGLAREATGEECRITRSGATVGTVDYISPEQARDSRLADVRSDIYSLGCTLFHMLGGQAPFPEGSVTERLLKHIEAEPPDINRLNPDVSPALKALLERMLAKKPEDRYQTPAELIDALANLDRYTPPPTSHLDVLAGLADAPRKQPAGAKKRGGTEAKEGKGARPGSSGSRRAVAGRKSRSAADTRGGAATKTSPAVPKQIALFGKQVSPLWIGGGVGAVVLLVVFLVVALSGDRRRHPDDNNSGGSTQYVEGPPAPVTTEPEIQGGTPPPKDTAHEKPPEGPPRLYVPSTPINAAALQREFEASWSKEQPPTGQPVVYQISRSAALGASGTESRFDSLAAACAAAPADRPLVLEVHDNGPLFQAPVAVTGRDLTVRAAPGYRPLLVWDLGGAAGAAPSATEGAPAGGLRAFLGVTRGRLTLENVAVAVKWSDTPGSACFFRVNEGGLPGERLHLFPGRESGERGEPGLPGRPGDPAHLPATPAPAPRCRLSRCFVRGANVTVLDTQAPGTEALLEECLVVGGEQPLFQVSAPDDPATTLRVARSTLVGRQTFLRVRPAAGAHKPAVHWVGWDALLARSNSSAGGELVSLTDGALPEALSWRAVNCLYTGWRQLLAGPENIAATDGARWQQRWGGAAGDRALTPSWPPGEEYDPAEVSPRAYNPDGSPVGFAASAGSRTLGCPLTALPPAGEHWLPLTYDRFVGGCGPGDFLTDDTAPPFPTGERLLFHGTRVDLNTTDLGAYLQDLAKKWKFGPRVVLHLTGTGPRHTTPIHIQGSTLVLYFEPPAEKAEPLVLTTPGTTPTDQRGLIEVEDGNLEIIGGGLRCPDFKSALVPPYLVAVRGGDLRLHRCRLEGPLREAPASYRGLIGFTGSGSPEPEKPRLCTLDSSVLTSALAGVELDGPGTNLGLQQCVVVCDDAVHIKPGDQAGARLHIHCLLEHTTTAARRAVVSLDDVPEGSMPQVPVVVQTRASAFLDPFTEPKGTPLHRAGLVLAAGAALDRGLLLWRGEDDLFDKRLSYQIAAGVPPEQPQPQTLWARFWGPSGEVRPVLDVNLRTTLSLDRLQLEHLAVPLLPRFKGRPPGADLVELGIIKKKSTP